MNPKVNNQNGGIVISVRLIFKRWVIPYFKIVFICRCCGNYIDTINFIDILTSYVCLLFIYLTMNTIYGSVSKWQRRHFWQKPRKQFRLLETREKALKYAISKYAIWKNIAHFPPMQSNRNNIKVYNNSIYFYTSNEGRRSSEPRRIGHVHEQQDWLAVPAACPSADDLMMVIYSSEADWSGSVLFSNRAEVALSTIRINYQVFIIQQLNN